LPARICCPRRKGQRSYGFGGNFIDIHASPAANSDAGDVDSFVGGKGLCSFRESRRSKAETTPNRRWRDEEIVADSDGKWRLGFAHKSAFD